jgi:hypothetical protein
MVAENQLGGAKPYRQQSLERGAGVPWLISFCHGNDGLNIPTALPLHPNKVGSGLGLIAGFALF